MVWKRTTDISELRFASGVFYVSTVCQKPRAKAFLSANVLEQIALEMQQTWYRECWQQATVHFYGT